MLRSLRSRLFLTYLSVAGLVLAVVGLLFFLFLVRAPNPIGQVIEYRRLDFWLSQFTGGEMRGVLTRADGNLAVALDRIDQAAKARTILIGSNGEVIGDSRSDEGALDLEILKQVTTGEGRQRGAYQNPAGKRWLYVSSSLSNRYHILLTAPQPTFQAVGLWGDELVSALIQAGAMALIVSAVLAWLIARWVAAPLGHAAQAAMSVAAGDFDQHIEPGGPSETESLAIAFNEMVRRVQFGRQAQRDFVANVSHELKTPLTSIQGFAQAILDGTVKESKEQKQAAKVIYEESERLTRLVEDLLDLARIDAGQVVFKRHPVDLGQLLKGVIERMNTRASESGVKLVDELPKLPHIIGDGDRLAQVFTNLMDNAIKYSAEGGEVTLRGEEQSGWISVHVDDIGTGIPTDELSRIFERFYQLDKARAGGSGRGVGLGLAISREIVQAHGGRLVVQSEEGRGSRFTVQLPIIHPDDDTMTSAPPS
jgi:signal transduction histidine kinase